MSVPVIFIGLYLERSDPVILVGVQNEREQLALDDWIRSHPKLEFLANAAYALACGPDPREHH